MNAYTDRILGFVGDRDPVEILAETPSRLEDLYWELKDKKLGVPFAEGKWTARQILAHLVDVECAWSFRVRLALTADHPTIQPYDQDAFVGLYKGIDASLAVEAFRSLRTWNLELVRSLSPEQAARGAFHPERGEEPVGRMISLIAGHDLNHLAQLELIAKG
jgi:uncharacterized damage-inducible protein DinB